MFGRESDYYHGLLGGLNLSSMNDLFARANELAAFGDEFDPHFVYGVAAGSVEVPLPNWDAVPEVTITETNGTKRIVVAAWPRPGHPIAERIFRFQDDAEGQRVKEEVRKALAAGRAIEVGSGVVIERDVQPKLVQEFSGDILWNTHFTPREPVHLIVACDSPQGSFSLDLPLQSVPPRGPHLFTFAALKDGLWFELNLFEDTKTTGRLWLYLGTMFGPSASENLRIGRTVLQWMTRTSLAHHWPATALGAALRYGGGDRYRSRRNAGEDSAVRNDDRY